MATLEQVGDFATPRIRRNPDGKRITAETAHALEIAEREDPLAVRNVIVLLNQEMDGSAVQDLLGMRRSAESRRIRASILAESAQKNQERIVNWLWTDRSARDDLGRKGLFEFNPSVHVTSLANLNCLVVPATSNLVNRIFEFPEALAVFRDLPLMAIRPQIATASEVRMLAAAGQPTQHRDGYTWGWQRMRLPQIHAEGFSGEGVIVGIADSGVYEVADLKGRIVDFAKVQPGGSVQPAHLFDAVGHGTGMGGIIAGDSKIGISIGGATAAQVKAVSIMDGDSGSAVDLLKGLNWLIDPGAVDIINLSAGFVDGSKVVRDFGELFRMARVHDVILTAAIGNHAGDSRYPAAFPDVLGCGALTAEDRVWEDSGHGADFVLPGVSVYSCVPPLQSQSQGLSYAWFTGTSAASAHATGLFALIANARTDKSGHEIAQAMLDGAIPIDGAGVQRAGRGVPDFTETLRFLDNPP